MIVLSNCLLIFMFIPIHLCCSQFWPEKILLAVWVLVSAENSHVRWEFQAYVTTVLSCGWVTCTNGAEEWAAGMVRAGGYGVDLGNAGFWTWCDSCTHPFTAAEVAWIRKTWWGSIQSERWLLREEEPSFFGDILAGRLLMPEWIAPHPCTCGQQNYTQHY